MDRTFGDDPLMYTTSSSRIGQFQPTGSFSWEKPPTATTYIMKTGSGTHYHMKPAPVRYNELRASPAGAPFRLCVVEFNVPGARNGGSDKGPNGHRIDSIPIANGVIAAGGACSIIKYSHDDHKGFVAKVDGNYDAFIVRINPGQLSQGTLPGTQERFDALMNSQIAKGKLGAR